MDSQTNVLITGANGYIGSHVVRAFLDLGCSVTAVSRHGDGIDTRARFVACDVLDERQTDCLVDEADKFGVCVHLAYRNGFVHNAPSHLEDVARHYAFLEALADAGCPRIAVMGSMHEVGYHEGAVTENTPCAPSSMYGIAKNALREALFNVLASRYEGSLVWLRGYYIYGDDLRSSSVFGKMVQASQAGKTVFPFTSGTNRCDFIHVDDLATQIAVAAMAAPRNAVVNCCTGRPVSLGEQAVAFIEQNGLGLSLQYGVFPDRPYDSPVIYGDAGPIQQLLLHAQGVETSVQAKARLQRALACTHMEHPEVIA